MEKMKHWYFVLFMFMVACATVQPETLAQRLLVVDANVTAIANTVGDLREQGLISDAQYPDMVKQVKAASDGVDAAWLALGAGDLTTTQDRIRLVNSILLELRKKLQEAEQ